MAESVGQHVGELVEVRGEFLPFIDLRQVRNASYRRTCRDSYIYTDEDFRFFQLLYRGIAGLLPQKKRNLILLGPFGVGKSLNLMVTYDLFTSKYNGEVLKNFSDANLKAQLTSLTKDGPFLVIVLMGTKVEGSLQDALVEALLQALPADIELASDFNQAAQYLDWLSTPDQRDLKDRFEQALRLRSPSLDLIALRKGITSRREFLELFREVYESAIGASYTRLSAANPSAIYAEAVKELVGKGKPYSGLLVLFDEFGQWVNDRARGEDYPTLTEFAEWMHSCENAFMVVATQTIPQSFNTTDDYDRFHTYLGRCETFELRREHYEDLIAGALRERGRRKDAVKTHPSWKKLAEIQRSYHPAYGADAQKAVWGYYPFHPGVIAALRPLADTLGQYERTIFKFVDPTEEQGFGAFLNEPTFHDDGSLNLLTLDRLFPYFRREIQQELADTYNRYEEAAKENHSDHLSIRVLHLLVLLHVLGSRAPCTSSMTNLADLLAESDNTNLAEALNRLEDQGHVFIENGTYRLTEAGAITRRHVESRLNQVVRQTGFVSAQDILTELQNYAGLAATIGEPGRRPDLPISGEVESRSFLQRYSIHRRFSLKPISWRDVSSLADDSAKGSRISDPTSVHVVVVTEEENQRGTALNEARKAAILLASRGMCVGVPVAPFQNAAVVRAVRAVKALESERPYSGTRALDIVRKLRFRDLLNALDEFCSIAKFEWYSPLGSPMTAPSSIDDLADRLALHYGAKFPPGIKSVDAVGAAINTDVVLKLSKSVSFGIGVQKRKADQIIEQALVPLGLVQVGKRKPTDSETPAKVAKPDSSTHKESAEIYEVLEGAFPPGRHGSDQIGAKVQTLLQPPYWLPRDLCTYYLAAFLTNREALLESNGYEQPHDRDVLRKLIDTGGKGFTVVVPKPLTLNDAERGFLHAIAGHMAGSIKNPSYMGSLKVSRENGLLRRREWEQIAADLRVWHREVGVVAKARSEERPESLDKFAQRLLSVLEQGFTNGSLEAPEFLVRTIPSKLSSNDKLGTLGTKVVTALGSIQRLAKTRKPAPVETPANQPSEESPDKEPNASEPVAGPKKSAQEVPLSLDSVQVLLGALEDVRRSMEDGTEGPSFEQLVERMRSAIVGEEAGAVK